MNVVVMCMFVIKLWGIYQISTSDLQTFIYAENNAAHTAYYDSYPIHWVQEYVRACVLVDMMQ